MGNLLKTCSGNRNYDHSTFITLFGLIRLLIKIHLFEYVTNFRFSCLYFNTPPLFADLSLIFGVFDNNFVNILVGIWFYSVLWRHVIYSAAEFTSYIIETRCNRIKNTKALTYIPAQLLIFIGIKYNRLFFCISYVQFVCDLVVETEMCYMARCMRYIFDVPSSNS